MIFTYKYDGTPPINPDLAVEATTIHDIWQNWTGSPSFTWTGAYDEHSGVNGSYYYFGPNSSGESENYTTNNIWDSPPVPDGIYYLRIRTKDNVSHLADDWANLYTFKYDNTTPINPTNITEWDVPAKDDVWQNISGDSNFTWSGAYDNTSGLNGYCYYWGTNETGTSDNYTVNSSFDPSVVGDGTCYLRIATVDNASNHANWTTMFTFRYDNTTPFNPNSAVQTVGPTEDDTWQNYTYDPAFNWSGAFDETSGVDGYYYYFGPDPSGTSNDYTTEDGIDPPLVEDGTYYLRVKTRDRTGNNASWVTLYTFRYDGTLPLNPTEVTQTVGETESDVWQNSVDKPRFTWSGASDITSGIECYYYYWGVDQNGTSSQFTKKQSYDPPAIEEDGTYYLRVCTMDIGKTLAGWITLYIFRYESTAPPALEPDDDFEGYSSFNTPTFTWGIPEDLSGISGFYYKVDDGEEIWTEEDSVKLEPQSDGTHTFYVKAMDIAGNIGEFGSHEFLIDTENPYGHILINDDDIYTTSTKVTLSVFGVDDTGGVSEMRFSDDAEYWSDWEPVESTFEWDLPVGDGEKTVYVEFRDVAGLISTQALSDTIILDTTLPRGTFTINDGDKYTTDPTVILSMMGEDKNGIMSMRFSDDGKEWTEWEPYNDTREYTLPEGDGLKTIYAVFMDAAGLESSVAISARITLDTTPPTGTLVINGDEEYTLILSVELALTYEDENSVAEMRFSDDGENWTDWEPVDKTSSYPILDGEGTKTVYVQFRDIPGLVSTSEITDGIMLYTTDTDSDGTVDFLDEDDDNDGYTDVEEREAGTDSLDTSDHPAEDSGSFLLFAIIAAVLLLIIIGAVIGAFLFLRSKKKPEETEEKKTETPAPAGPPLAGAPTAAPALTGITAAPAPQLPGSPTAPLATAPGQAPAPQLPAPQAPPPPQQIPAVTPTPAPAVTQPTAPAAPPTAPAQAPPMMAAPPPGSQTPSAQPPTTQVVSSRDPQ